jgi:hypothetical protein
MASGDRFYLLELKHRPALHGDLGSVLKVEGIVIGGEGTQAVFMLPSSTFTATDSFGLTAEEWVELLRRTDDPEVLVGPAKAFHRKVRYEISGSVQQKVWLADGLKCMFCNAKMGDVQLTIDHFVPLELGGKNDTSNYLSACRRCNKSKGAMPAQDWCDSKGLDYDTMLRYLADRKV